MRLLVTGANGLVGSRLSALLTQRGHEVLAVSRGPWRGGSAILSHRGFEYFPGELSRDTEVKAAFAKGQPQVVLHAASMTEVDRCEQNPNEAFASNVIATANVARAAQENRAQLIYVSTDYVFDGGSGPYGEEDVPHPQGVYALTKQMGEQAVRVLSTSWAIARTAVVYGWPAAGRANFGSWLVTSLKDRRPVPLFVDQRVSPTLASSAARMLAELAERKLTGIWNICGAEVVDRLTFGKTLSTVFGFDPALCVPSKLAEAKLASPRPIHSGLRPDKARDQLQEKPLSLRDALAQFRTEYLQAH
jgi:dTDP-4-dehydrorhamnose reductase